MNATGLMVALDLPAATRVLAVQVHPNSSRPHFLARKGMAGGTYSRGGSTDRLADTELIQELGRFARGKVFDEQPMPGLDSEAIDFRAASESFVSVRRLARLVGRGLVREIGTGPQDPRRRYFLAEGGLA